MRKNTFKEFNAAMRAMDWEKAIMIGVPLADWFGESPGFDPKTEAFIHLNLGLAYKQAGAADAYDHDDGSGVGFERSHAEDHLEAAKKLAVNYGLEKIAAAADKIRWHFGEDPAAGYVDLAKLVDGGSQARH